MYVRADARHFHSIIFHHSTTVNKRSCLTHHTDIILIISLLRNINGRRHSLKSSVNNLVIIYCPWSFWCHSIFLRWWGWWRVKKSKDEEFYCCLAVIVLLLCVGSRRSCKIWRTFSFAHFGQYMPTKNISVQFYLASWSAAPAAVSFTRHTDWKNTSCLLLSLAA